MVKLPVLPDGRRSGEEGKQFFFEKRTKKLSNPGPGLSGEAAATTIESDPPDYPA
jgi:hypothetical protein